MDMKKIMIGSLIMNLLLVALIINVKSNSKSQAQEVVKKVNSAAKKLIDQKNETMRNNDLLWQLAFSIKDGDGSLKSVMRLAKKARLPEKKTEEEARLGIQQKMVDGKRVVDIYWARYGFSVLFDKKDKVEKLDMSNLLFQKGK